MELCLSAFASALAPFVMMLLAARAPDTNTKPHQCKSGGSERQFSQTILTSWPQGAEGPREPPREQQCRIVGYGGVG